MGNVFAIGIPDKVSVAERDRKAPNHNSDAIEKLVCSITPKEQKKHDNKMLKKAKVIEFDLPKGYSAEDAFISALEINLSLGRFKYFEYGKFIPFSVIRNHFKYEMWDLEQRFEAATFYLLLAVANGHELK